MSELWLAAMRYTYKWRQCHRSRRSSCKFYDEYHISDAKLELLHLKPVSTLSACLIISQAGISAPSEGTQVKTTAHGEIRLISVELPQPGHAGLFKVASTRAQCSPLNPHSPGDTSICETLTNRRGDLPV